MCSQFLICVLCACHFIGLLCRINVKRNLFCQSVISCMEENIVDALSYTSPSCQKAHR